MTVLCNRKRVRVSEVYVVFSPWGYPYAIYKENTPHDKKRYFTECGEGTNNVNFVVEADNRAVGISQCKEYLQGVLSETMNFD